MRIVFAVLSYLAPLFSVLFLSLTLPISLLPPLLPSLSHTPLPMGYERQAGRCSRWAALIKGFPTVGLCHVRSVQISEGLAGKESVFRFVAKTRPDTRRRPRLVSREGAFGLVLAHQPRPRQLYFLLSIRKTRPLNRRWSICVITSVSLRFISVANVHLLNLVSHTWTISSSNRRWLGSHLDDGLS